MISIDEITRIAEKRNLKKAANKYRGK